MDRELIAAVKAGLTARADPEKAAGMRAYMKSAMPFYGVQKPGRTELLRALGPADVQTALALWREAEQREERYIALAWIEALPVSMALLAVYEELIVSGAWWDFVDAVAAGPIGRLLAHDPALVPVLRAWSADADLWKRRGAIICQVRRKRETDFPLLAELIEPNRADPEFFIRKGIGWALRAYAWVDPETIVHYCETHELSALSHREALRNVLAGRVR